MATENQKVLFWSATTGLVVWLLMRRKPAEAAPPEPEPVDLQFRTNSGQYLGITQQLYNDDGSEGELVEVLPQAYLSPEVPLDAVLSSGHYVAQLYVGVG